MIFVDTGAWFAAFVAGDPDHQRADAFLASPGDQLLTTDYVVDELLTLLKVRRQSATAFVLGERLFAGELCQLEFVTEQDFRAAWNVFRARRDKGWSFTDCVSQVVMQRLGIRHAFTFDEHFRQFGTVATSQLHRQCPLEPAAN